MQCGRYAEGKMKRGLKYAASLTAAFFCLGGALLQAQAQKGYSETRDADFQGRAAVKLRYSPFKDLSLQLGGQVRAKDNFTSFDRGVVNLGVKYSPWKYLSVLCSYDFHAIKARRDGEDYCRMKHRLSAGLEGKVTAARVVKFSLKEQWRCTWRADSVNLAEKPNPAMDLCSRLRVGYSPRHLPLEPYLSFELRNTLNANRFDLTFLKDNSGGGKPSGVGNYISALIYTAGVEYRFNRHDSIDAYYSFYDDRAYSANIGKNSGSLNRMVYSRLLRSIIGVEYVHRF